MTGRRSTVRHGPLYRIWTREGVPFPPNPKPPNPLGPPPPSNGTARPPGAVLPSPIPHTPPPPVPRQSRGGAAPVRRRRGGPSGGDPATAAAVRDRAAPAQRRDPDAQDFHSNCPRGPNWWGGGRGGRWPFRHIQSGGKGGQYLVGPQPFGSLRRFLTTFSRPLGPLHDTAV